MPWWSNQLTTRSRFKPGRVLLPFRFLTFIMHFMSVMLIYYNRDLSVRAAIVPSVPKLEDRQFWESDFVCVPCRDRPLHDATVAAVVLGCVVMVVACYARIEAHHVLCSVLKCHRCRRVTTPLSCVVQFRMVPGAYGHMLGVGVCTHVSWLGAVCTRCHADW